MLRIARVEDSIAIAAIYRHYVNSTAITLEDVAPSAPAMRHKIAKLGAFLPFLVWEERSVYIRDDARGQGLGRRLLSALLELLRELGYVKVYAAIPPPNPASVALHRKLGFEPFCRFTDTAYKLGAWQSVEWMELKLRSPSDFPLRAPPLEPLAFSEFVPANPSLLASILGAERRTSSRSLLSSLS